MTQSRSWPRRVRRVLELLTRVQTDFDLDSREPRVPVLVTSSGDSLRICLGVRDVEDLDGPDLFIERDSRGWRVFCHPNGGDDPVAVLDFRDDGRIFFERTAGSDIRVLEPGEENST